MDKWKDCSKNPPPEDKLIIVKIKEKEAEYITVAFYKTINGTSTWKYITESLKANEFTCNISKISSDDEEIEIISWQPMPTNHISHS